MSTLHHHSGPEEPAPPRGFDPTRDVMQPPGPVSARPPYRPLSGRAAAATAVLGILLVLDIAAVVSGYFEVQLLDRFAAGENVPDAQADANDTRQAMIGLGQGALWVACAIVFISWMHRAYENISAVAPPYPRYGSGWTIGAWFVPILNFFRPKQLINDIWDSGGPAAAKGPPAWLMVWWIGFLISGVLGRIATPNLDEDASLADLRSDSINFMVSDGFDVVVLALAILVVRTCTRRQEAKADAQLAAAGQPAPVPVTVAAFRRPEPAADTPAEPVPGVADSPATQAPERPA